MEKIKIKKTTILIIIFLINANFILINEKKVVSLDPWFTLVAVSNPGIGLDYLNIIKDHLWEIGINIDIRDEALWELYPDLLIEENFDLFYHQIDTSNIFDPYYFIKSYYSENGFKNWSGYYQEIDFDEELGMGKNEWYIKELGQITPKDDDARYELCWEWQNYLMDHIVACYPLFIYKDYLVHFSNLNGFNYEDGLMQSFGKLSWDGLHEGQINTNELVIALETWEGLEPFNDTFSKDNLIADAILDPLLWCENDKTLYPHLAKEIEYLNDNYIRIYLRENIKWQNDSENVFHDKYLTSKDVYFTFFMHKYFNDLDWLEEVAIYDETAIDLLIKEDEQIYSTQFENYLYDLAKIKILPEFYLNQSQLADGKTPDINHNSWNEFIKQPFGTSLLKITDVSSPNELKLEIFPDSWWINENINSDNALDWENRFGSFDNPINELRIKVIPEYGLIINEFNFGRIDLFELEDYLDYYYSIFSNCTILSKNSGIYDMLVFNLKEYRVQMGDIELSEQYPEYTKGRFLRKAISYAIDRDEINQIFHGGRLDNNYWPIPTNLGKWCDPDIGIYCKDRNWSMNCMFCAGYDLCCANMYEKPKGFPDWKYACDQSTGKLENTVTLYLPAIFTICIIVKIKIKKGKKE